MSSKNKSSLSIKSWVVARRWRLKCESESDVRVLRLSRGTARRVYLQTDWLLTDLDILNEGTTETNHLQREFRVRFLHVQGLFLLFKEDLTFYNIVRRYSLSVSQTLFVDVTLTVKVGPKGLQCHYRTITTVAWLPAETIYWTNCKCFGKYEAFTH